MSYIPSTDVCIQVLETFVFIVELIIYRDTNRKMKLNDFTRRNVRFDHILCSYFQFLEIITLFLIYTFVCVYCKIGSETNRKQKKNCVYFIYFTFAISFSEAGTSLCQQYLDFFNISIE
jgi:hypothetical protein